MQYFGDMKIGETLKHKFPNMDFLTEVQLFDDGRGVYIKKWDSKYGKKPNEQMLNTWAKEIEPIKQLAAVRSKRRNEYPSIGDQLDAIHKQLAALAGKNLVSYYKIIKDKVLAVKAKYPKPELKDGE